MTIKAPQTSAKIRKINVRLDLLAVAELIEVCFSSTLDEDGRDYLRQLRHTARESSYLTWLQGTAERLSMPLYGFVWEEDKRIVGNLSLIPFYRGGKVIYLIANVAVHPDFRRRGIARQLTQAALDNLRLRGVKTAWLQVRDDNPVAYGLYLSLGFVERARRTTWQGNTSAPPLPRQSPGGISIHPRRAEDWSLQANWLRQVYPPEVAWNLPLHPARFHPGLWNRLYVFLRGEGQKHWVARRGSAPIGFLTWEPTRTAADNLWLAAPKQEEEQAIGALLPYARETLYRHRRLLSLNYPAERGREAFLRSGFTPYQTLIWMSVSL
jgi:ribosomal protein S18 acetylase RimI-like enzyme